MREVLLGDNLEKPDGWADKYNFRLLNPSQYDLPPRAYDGSRCIVRRIRQQGADVDVVIPRTLIEQVFYFPDSYMVNVAAKGDWEAQKNALIVFKTLDNGLETAICAETGAWKVVVRTHVLDRYAEMMALFAHSSYAQQSANLIHTRALQERGLDRYAPWHASGRIPWDPELGPFRLQLRGFMLKSNRMKGSGTFLATHVAGWTLPEYVPYIEAERENSGLKSQQGTEDRNRSRGGRSERRGNSEREIQSGVDADPSQGNEGFDTTATAWLEEPRIRTQAKLSHISPTGEPTQQQDDPNQSNQGSTGQDSGQYGNPGKVAIRAVRHPSAASFGRILKALEDLKEEKFISDFLIYGPKEAAQREERGEASCWNFLSDKVRKAETGKLPTRGWFIVNPRDGSPRPRAALVLHIVMGKNVLYWIEIERRDSEAGMRSPILANIPESRADSLIDWTLLQISENEGRNLAAIVRSAVGDQSAPASAAVFQHAYAYERAKPESNGTADAGADANPPSAEGSPTSQVADGAEPALGASEQKRVKGLNLDGVKRVLLRAVTNRN